MRRVLMRALVVVSVLALLAGALRLPAVIHPARPGAAVAAAHGRPSLLTRIEHALGIGVPKQRPSLVDDGRHALPTKPSAGGATAKRVRELAARRQANARYFQLSDGRVQAELSALPINYRDAHGHWQPISTGVVATTARPGFQFGNQSNRFQSFFGANPASLLRVEAAGTQLTIGLLDASPGVVPTVRGDTVTYHQIRPGVDLVYQVTASALKERLVLTAPTADPNVTFTLHASGATPRTQPDGTIALAAPDGRPVFTLPRLFMVDAKDDPASPYGKQWSAGVTQTLSPGAQGADARVTVKADAAWLASPTRVYPVIVDPTITIQQLPGEATDAMVVSDTADTTLANTNYGTAWNLGVGITRTAIERSLVQFNLKTIPTGTQIDAADLRLFYDQVDYSDANAVTLEAHRATAAWDESTVTWNTPRRRWWVRPRHQPRKRYRQYAPLRDDAGQEVPRAGSGRTAPARGTVGVGDYGVGSGKVPEKMSLLPKVAGQSFWGWGWVMGEPAWTEARQASMAGQSAALRVSFQTVTP